MKRFVDEEDDSYESSSGSEDSGDDSAESSDEDANPYADGLLPHIPLNPPPRLPKPISCAAVLLDRLIGICRFWR